jgi:hypothetical protein
MIVTAANPSNPVTGIQQISPERDGAWIIARIVEPTGIVPNLHTIQIAQFCRTIAPFPGLEQGMIHRTDQTLRGNFAHQFGGRAIFSFQAADSARGETNLIHPVKPLIYPEHVQVSSAESDLNAAQNQETWVPFDFRERFDCIVVGDREKIQALGFCQFDQLGRRKKAVRTIRVSVKIATIPLKMSIHHRLFLCLP